MLRLKAELRRRDMSQSALARKAEVCESAVSSIMAGLRPGPVRLKRIATALNWPIERAHELLEEVEDQ